MPKLIPALFTLATFWGACALHAETIYALSYSGGPADLFSFDSATPSVITTPRPITGLAGRPFDLAVRPADGQLYTEVGSYVYRINPATAQATLLFESPALRYITGNSTIAFNPVTGLLRVIGDQLDAGSFSFRVNVDTGAVIQDRYSSFLPSGLAYTNNYAGANSTTLYGLDAGYLVIGSSDESRFTTVGPLGVPRPTTGPVFGSLSISGLTGTAYASFAVQNGGPPNPYSSQFYTVDLSTEAGTLVGTIGDGALFVGAIAAPVGPSQIAPVPEPRSWALLGAGLLLGGTLRRFRPRHLI